MSKVTAFQPKKDAYSAGDVVVERIKITPITAAKWLQQNTLNRPLRPKHVRFLANEIQSGRWLFNAESIKISDDEQVLDGQHRLHACVEAGMPFESLVVYGLTREAFKTIDTGAVRTPADVVSLHYPDAPKGICSTVAQAVKWVYQIKNGLTTESAYRKLSNGEILGRLMQTPELWRCAEIVHAHPKDQRVIANSIAVALLYLFGQKDWGAAEHFMERVGTGQGLTEGDVVYLLRGLFLREQRTVHSNMKSHIKVFILVKAWNSERRGRPIAHAGSLKPRADETFPNIL